MTKQDGDRTDPSICNAMSNPLTSRFGQMGEKVGASSSAWHQQTRYQLLRCTVPWQGWSEVSEMGRLPSWQKQRIAAWSDEAISARQNT